ncbi:hypothetical protein OQA88_1857 [Cercophora sp. LCS_1]
MSQLPGLPGYDPDTIQPWTVDVVVSVTVLAVVAVGLRLWSRYIKGQPFWWDDWVIIFSLFWNLAVVGFIFAMHACGMGLHADKVPMDDIVLMAKFLVVAEILYVFNLVWTKISILLMYYRIFHFPFFKKMAYGIGAFIIAWVVCITFLFIFICVPVEKLWYPDLPGRCIDQVGTWIANAVSTIVSDLAILILPIPQVWKLQLGRAAKIGVTIAFCLGFFVVFASAYRFSVLFSYSASDPTYTLAPTVGWTAIEMSAGIVSACLPTLGPVMITIGRTLGIRWSLLGSLSSSRGGASKSTRPSGQLTTTKTEIPSRKDSIGTFYRLPDESANVSGETANRGHRRPDDGLRPDHKHAYTVSSKPGTNVKSDNESLSGDEIPLQGIMVRTDFQHSSAGGECV